MPNIEIPNIPVDEQGRKTHKHVHGGFVGSIELTKCGFAHLPKMLPAPPDAPWCEECLALDG